MRNMALKTKAAGMVIALALITSVLFVPTVGAQDDAYVYTLVGGIDQAQTYPDQTLDEFELTGLSYRSLYPHGMEFKATITPPEGVTLSQVTLFYTFATGKTGRVRAVPGSQPGEWIATPYNACGLPPWHEIEAYWGVRTSGGKGVDSHPVHAVYYDASREWYRAENEDVIVYWFDMPVELGRYVTQAVASNRERYEAGFGIVLPYRPVAVIFPPGAAWNEYRCDTSINDTDFGFTGTTIPEAGGTIQRVRTLEPAAIRKDCIWNPVNPTVEFQMNQAASTTVHEIAHLYQDERGVSGPNWWVEGQATFFETFDEYPVHERLRTLGQMQGGSFPSFQGEGPGGGALTTAEDGCTHLIYDMGSSFMRWLVDSHGGITTYRAVVDEMARAIPLSTALETATGLTFLELENEWRAFLGVGEVPPEVLDPSLVLGEPAEPFFAVGEQLVLPSNPFQQSIYGKPSIRSIATAACFANNPVTILQAGSDGTMNWYRVDCMGMTGWMNQGQLVSQ